MTDHVDITIVCENTPFETRISKDGDLEFLNYDINYDILAESLGEDETSAIKLLNRWYLNPTSVLGREPNLDEGEYEEDIKIGIYLENRVKFILATNFCDHTSNVYTSLYKMPLEMSSIFSILYENADMQGGYSPRINEAVHMAKNIFYNYTKGIHQLERNEIGYWLNGIRRAAVINSGERFEYQLYDVAKATALARAFSVQKYATEKWEEALKEEQVWQIRRFIDVLAAYQENKPLPDVEETT